MKQFVKFLLLTQTASDAGKGFISTKSSNAGKAIKENYNLKDEYIKQCIHYAKKEKNVHIGTNIDNYMTVIIFDIEGYGQVSFHSFTNFKNYVKVDKDVVWNGVKFGSVMTCKRLAKKFNLPFYKHKKRKKMT